LTSGVSDVQLDAGWELLEGGAGSPARRVLMLPANMATAEFFRGMVDDPALADAGVRAVAATPPGFGGLAPPPRFDFSLASYARLIEDRATAGGFDLVVGHSLSADALVEVADRGRYEGGLVLVAPALRASSEAQAGRNLDRFSRLPLVGSAAWFGTMLGLGLGMRGELPGERHSALVAEMRRNPTRRHRRWLMASFDHLRGWTGRSATVLARAGGRVSLVRGAQDAVALDPDDRATLEAGGVPIFEIPDAGHFVVVQRPREVNEAVLAALAALDR
jgi:pimeloyl-ACP methyl ester carboxylesterase